MREEAFLQLSLQLHIFPSSTPFPSLNPSYPLSLGRVALSGMLGSKLEWHFFHRSSKAKSKLMQVCLVPPGSALEVPFGVEVRELRAELLLLFEIHLLLTLFSGL